MGGTALHFDHPGSSLGLKVDSPMLIFLLGHALQAAGKVDLAAYDRIGLRSS